MKMKYRWLLLITPVLMADAHGEIDATVLKIKRISDGDTLVSTEDIRIRLWGIDTPERDQPYGDSATGALANMLDNQKLYLKTMDVDRYGRKVAVIYTADGDEVNLKMVCDGHAWWYERYASRASDYEQCQEDAQKNKRGLWAEENPLAPWDWRRK